MKGKITLETCGGAEICCSVEMKNMSRKDKILLIDALCTALDLDALDILVLAQMLVDGKIGRKDIPGKTVITTDAVTVKKIVEKKKQKSEWD